MKLNKGFKVKMGDWESMIYGGPYSNFDPQERRLFGVKMAVEIEHPHDLSIPTRDYSIPSVEILIDGLKEVFRQIRLGKDIYVGCMGGVGRTGLFMGCLLKCVDRFYEMDDVPVEVIISRVRTWYNPHAIETKEQGKFIEQLDVKEVVEFMHKLYDTRVKEVVKEVEKEVVVVKYQTFWEWVLRFWGFGK